MDEDNEFDRRLEIAAKSMPSDVRGALVDSVDTLDLWWSAALSIFKKQARPQDAVALCQVVMNERARVRSLPVSSED